MEDDHPTDSHKRARLDSGGGDLKRVAEIVMVLSAMGKMRAGRGPSAVEKGLMAEAREKLAAMCESSAVAPKDLVTRDAVRVLVEDLGLNRSRDVMRFGFRAPKMSISEKFSFVKRKMEESNEFAAQSAAYSSQPLQVSSSANFDSHASSCNAGATHIPPPDKPSSMPLSAGGFQPTSPLVFVPALAPASSMNQSQVMEMPPAFVLMPFFGSPAQSDSSSLQLARTEAAHFRLDARPAYLSQAQANYSGNHLLENASTSSVTVAQVGQATNVPDHTPTAEVAQEVTAFQSVPQGVQDQLSAVQTASGNLQTVHQPMQGMNFEQAHSLYTNHNEIARNVQKIVQPKRRDNSNWTPPTDYMSKALTCQMCKVSVHDVESLLVCDACEKGVHLKCLQSYYQKGIPAGDWHCPKCLLASNGKPLPKKYGPVCRSISASKVSSNKNGAHSSVEKRAENPDQKVNHQKIMPNGNPGLANPAHVASTGNSHIEPSPDTKMPIAREVQGADCSVSRSKMGDRSYTETCMDFPKEREGVAFGLAETPHKSAPQHIQNGESFPHEMEKSTSAPMSLPKAESESSFPDQQSDTGVGNLHQSQALHRSREGVKTRSQTSSKASANQMHEIGKHAFEGLKRPADPREVFQCNLGSDINWKDRHVDQAIPNGTLDNGNSARDCSISSSDGLHSVDWVGDILRVEDERAYYSSCCINGAVYKLQDYALIRSSNQNPSPSKLLALWEDKETGSKWATANRCYFPADLPEIVGRPCVPENSEVYESNHGRNISVGLIHGPCEVHPPDRFKEEMEMRTQTGGGTNYGLHPVFMCRWFFDESKGLFQPITD
ncbi:uncharacterized protein LOC131219577 [Magnolia sinica]|uniref:uncharacterized protein LOC131219577 n=1 Tax=Magnolia sinica TaxID=86752 RepID=UPI00265B3E82|nr:uncharacterized protein LOC131219577 [Magnolia sinica]XP_058070784.1 uncharacterized protein LOC131219577 [Magnolia sinica]